jgi:hypothetical protein
MTLADQLIVVALGLERVDRSTEKAALKLREIAAKVARLEDRERVDRDRAHRQGRWLEFIPGTEAEE